MLRKRSIPAHFFKIGKTYTDLIVHIAIKLLQIFRR